MATKLKYAAIPYEDLIELHCLFIRMYRILQYLVPQITNSRLQNQFEAIQRTCHPVILRVMYVDYTSALHMCDCNHFTWEETIGAWHLLSSVLSMRTIKQCSIWFTLFFWVKLFRQKLCWCNYFFSFSCLAYP